MGEKCLTIYVHDVLEQRDGDGRGLGGRREKEKKGRRERKEGGRGHDNITGTLGHQKLNQASASASVTAY